jgi:Aerotolerance regulator N-terminal/von Willebrand factor type A domain
MFEFLINPWVLAGLAGIGLPVIAHLLSRRRFDVVQWAAMQFLDPAKKTRRRMKLEELLLLLLRIGLIILLVMAAARPWIPGGLLSGFRSSGSRAIVIVIDGSNSMTRTDGLNTLHQNAIRRAVEFLNTLGAGDEVALVDCRDQPRVVIASPLQDISVVADQLQALPPAGGFSDIQLSIERAIAILGRSSAASREVVVFTDRQRAGWMPDDQIAWERVDEMLQFPAVHPRVWCVDVSHQLAPMKSNIAVGQIELSRELTVPGFPLRFRTILRNASDAPVSVPVTLKLDGQTLMEQKQDVTIPGKGEVTVEFEHTLRQTGTRTISVVVQPANDAIAADNQSDAAVKVMAALPVLLINGTPARDAVGRATFFAEVALSDAGRELPWVAATVVEASQVTVGHLRAAQVVVLADVKILPDDIANELANFAARGNGVLIFCGSNCDPVDWKTTIVDSGLAPGVELVRIRQAPLNTEAAHPEPLSLVPGWLSRFRSDPGRSFLKAGFREWWLTKLNRPDAAGPKSDDEAVDQPETDVGSFESSAPPVVLARLNSGDPLLLQSQCGKGTVVVMTSTLDRDWNDLPAKADYVPFLHEAIFAVMSGVNQRNLLAGQPLVTQVPIEAGVDAAAGAYKFLDPSEQRLPAETRERDSVLQLRTDNTLLSGQYQLLRTTDDEDLAIDRFVVNYDHREDNADELTRDDHAKLITNDRLRFSESLEDLAQRMYGDESRAELWAILMFAFLALLTTEVWMTRRIVKRGYGE